MRYYQLAVAAVLMGMESSSAILLEGQGSQLQHLIDYKEPTTDDYVNEKIMEDRRLDAKDKERRDAKQFAQVQDQKAEKKFNEMLNEFKEFSRTLDTANFEKGMELKEQLAEGGRIEKSILNMGQKFVTTNAMVQKSFKFPNVSKNQFSQEQFDELEIAETNLNQDIDSEKALNAFIVTAKKVKSRFYDKFGNQWTDPADGQPETVALQEETDEIVE